MSLFLLSCLLIGHILAAPNPPDSRYNLVHEIIQIRQVASPSSTATNCNPNELYGILSLASDVPIPPPQLMDSTAYISDLCDPPSLTGPLSSIYTSYQSAALSWYEAHSSEVESWISSFSSKCPQYATGLVAAYSLPTCLPSDGMRTQETSTGTSATVFETSVTSATSSTTSTSGAKRQHNAVVFVVGILSVLLGVIIAL
ncbi:hypothetical protein AA313_de0206666 [Arthrobotrys entomopaga]|nr:hypothetical protein AA313_de0206666 [Arthrobotrys entomopaga]